MSVKFYSTEDVPKLCARLIDEAGGQVQFAKASRIEAQYISDFLNGTAVSNALMAFLGFDFDKKVGASCEREPDAQRQAADLLNERIGRENARLALENHKLKVHMDVVSGDEHRRVLGELAAAKAEIARLRTAVDLKPTRAPLTAAEVEIICRQIALAPSYAKFARRYGVALSMVTGVFRGTIKRPYGDKWRAVLADAQRREAA